MLHAAVIQGKGLAELAGQAEALGKVEAAQRLAVQSGRRILLAKRLVVLDRLDVHHLAADLNEVVAETHDIVGLGQLAVVDLLPGPLNHVQRAVGHVRAAHELEVVAQELQVDHLRLGLLRRVPLSAKRVELLVGGDETVVEEEQQLVVALVQLARVLAGGAHMGNLLLLQAGVTKSLAGLGVLDRHLAAKPVDLADSVQLLLLGLCQHGVKLGGQEVQRACASVLLQLCQSLHTLLRRAQVVDAELNARPHVRQALLVQLLLLFAAQRHQLLVESIGLLQVQHGALPVLLLKAGHALDPLKVGGGLQLCAGVADAVCAAEVVQQRGVLDSLAHATPQVELLARVCHLLQLHGIGPGPLRVHQHNLQVAGVCHFLQSHLLLDEALLAVHKVQRVAQAAEAACAVLPVALVVVVTEAVLPLGCANHGEDWQGEDLWLWRRRGRRGSLLLRLFSRSPSIVHNVLRHGCTQNRLCSALACVRLCGKRAFACSCVIVWHSTEIEKMAEFSWPWQYSFPPFFTLQPNQDTQRKQLEAWADLVLAYSRHHQLHTLDTQEALTLPLFMNKTINRKVSSEMLTVVLDFLASKGNLEWQNREKTRALLMWRSPQQWAQIIYDWAKKEGYTDTVCTVFELLEGSTGENSEFHKLDPDAFRKAIAELQKQGKAELFASDDGDRSADGVKFF
eukprot:m.200712 g.200712  ORF g.200712 m.200712 type:complete len:680 (+) comp17697_c0_seq3:6461-8500(+)